MINILFNLLKDVVFFLLLVRYVRLTIIDTL